MWLRFEVRGDERSLTWILTFSLSLHDHNKLSWTITSKILSMLLDWFTVFATLYHNKQDCRMMFLNKDIQFTVMWVAEIKIKLVIHLMDDNLINWLIISALISNHATSLHSSASRQLPGEESLTSYCYSNISITALLGVTICIPQYWVSCGSKTSLWQRGCLLGSHEAFNNIE